MRYLPESEALVLMDRIDSSLDEFLIAELFGADERGEPKYRPTDFFDIPENRCCGNLPGHTRLGVYMFNSFVIKPLYEKYPDYFGYENGVFNKGHKEDFESMMCIYVEKDIIEPLEMFATLDRIITLTGVRQMALISPTVTLEMITPFPGMEELKEKLFEEHAEELKTNPATAGQKIEKALVDAATEYLMNNPNTADNFASGAKISIGNNYKNMNIMMGPIKNSVTGDYNVLKSNFSTGVSKEEYAHAADSSVAGAFARAESTAVGGYMSAKFVRTLSDIYAADKGSDCGTKRTIPILIYPQLANEYIGMNVLVDGKVVNITNSNVGEFSMKTVNLFTPMTCQSPAPTYCNKCVGNKPYETEMVKYGPVIYRLSSTLLNMQLKKFHDMSVKVYSYTPTTMMRML